VSGFVLAARVGVSQNYFAKRLRDDAPFNMNDVEAICTALGVPLSQVFEEAGRLAQLSTEAPPGLMTTTAG
jgi:transcriptional regulator with XRE-family HTH domain